MSTPAIRAVLMAYAPESSDNGFHRITYKVEEGRSQMTTVAVMISRDAQRKLGSHLSRAGARTSSEKLLKAWARWAISNRLDETGSLPATITITGSDIDDTGAYASGLRATLD